MQRFVLVRSTFRKKVVISKIMFQKILFYCTNPIDRIKHKCTVYTVLIADRL